jgi:hypothetical protein
MAELGSHVKLGLGKKKVIIPYLAVDGCFQPKDTRILWLVACQAKQAGPA